MLLTATLSDNGLRRLIHRADSATPDALLRRLRVELRNWTRRAARKQGRRSLRLYMAWPSDLDGKTGEIVRPHLHVIVRREYVPALVSTWGLGEVFGENRPLYGSNHGDLNELVEYLMRQSRRLGTEKRYVPSRNLVPPTATRPRLARNAIAPLRLRKGDQFISRSEQRPGCAQVLRVYRPALEEADDE